MRAASTPALAVAVLAGLLLGCASVSGSPEPAFARVVISNDADFDADIFAERYNARVRLGRVPARSRRSLAVHADMLEDGRYLTLLFRFENDRQNPLRSQRYQVEEGGRIPIRIGGFPQ